MATPDLAALADSCAPCAAAFPTSPVLSARCHAILADRDRSRLGPEIALLHAYLAERLAQARTGGPPPLPALAAELGKLLRADRRMARRAHLRMTRRPHSVWAMSTETWIRPGMPATPPPSAS
jgi:hypothetical protein